MKSFKNAKNLGRSTGNNQDIHFYEEKLRDFLFNSFFHFNTFSDNKRNEVYKFFNQKDFIEKGTSLDEP
jgi:hypothetical protein